MKDYCLFACSDEFQLNHNATEFIRAMENLSRQIGVELTHLDYSCAEDDENTLMHESRFGPDAIHSLNRVLEEKTLLELLLWSVPGEPGKPSSPTLNAELHASGQIGGYNYVCIHFPMKLVEAMAAATIFSLTADLLTSLNHMGRLDYALVTTMDDTLPSAYFRGIFAPGLSKREALDLATWEHKYVERKIRLRGLYWGNLMSAEHVAQIPDRRRFDASLKQIEGLFRSVINGDDLFFMLPSTDMSDPSVVTLNALLREYDLLMQPDEKAVRIARSLLSS